MYIITTSNMFYPLVIPTLDTIKEPYTRLYNVKNCYLTQLHAVMEYTYMGSVDL